jgi:hypothetical protein
MLPVLLAWGKVCAVFTRFLFIGLHIAADNVQDSPGEKLNAFAPADSLYDLFGFYRGSAVSFRLCPR